jgi:hypothetical protein
MESDDVIVLGEDGFGVICGTIVEDENIGLWKIFLRFLDNTLDGLFFIIGGNKGQNLHVMIDNALKIFNSARLKY